MNIKQDEEYRVDKLEGWIIGGVSIASSGVGVFFWWFFKSLYKRIGVAEKDIARVESKSDLAIAKLDAKLTGVVEVIEVQVVQNSSEHGQLGTSMKDGMNSLGRSIDIIRSGQDKILDKLLDEKK